LFPLFATGVIDTGGKFAAVSLIPVTNLPLVSTTQAEVVHLDLRISLQIFEKNLK
jgi:hypothetical protein